MLQDLTPEAFEEHQGTPFHIDFGGEAPLEVKLHGVRRHEAHPGPRPQPFSAYFLGPARPLLRQHIFSVTHERMGALQIFLVPIGPDPKLGGMIYEAVFN